MRFLLALSLLAPGAVWAQTPAAPLPMPRLQFLDASGRPLAGGKVYTYQAGTSTPQVTYTDAGGVTANANPVILDAGGFGSFWVKTGVYKIVVQNSAGVQQWSADNVSNTALYNASTIGAGTLLYTAPGAGAVTRTIAAKLGDEINAADFGAVCDGSTDNATAFGSLAAFVNASAAMYRVQFPAGGVCVYSGGLWFQKPVMLDLGGATLNYTGSGNAIEFGSRTLSVADVPANRSYTVRGGFLTGGASMTNGIFFNQWITEPRVTDVHMVNFGNAAAGAAIWFQAQNWDAVVSDSSFIVEAGASNIARNWIWNNGASDNGQSRLRVVRCHGTVLVSSGGVGVYTNGFNSEISSSKIEGFTPNIAIGAWATASVVSNTYMESTRPASKGCMQYGDLSGSQIGTFIRNLRVVNSYCNTHNTDASITGAFLAPSTTSTGLINAIIENNSVAAKAAGAPLVALNNNPGQSGNFGANNWMLTSNGATWAWIDVLHTAGAAITGWAGTQGEVLDWTQSPTDAARFLDIKAGATADQFEGIRFFDQTGANKGQLYRAPSGYLKLSTGGTDAIILNSDGSIQLPKGAVDNAFLTLNSPAATSTPLIVNSFTGQTNDLVSVAGAGNTFSVSGAGVAKINGAAGIFATKTIKGSDGNNCTLTIAGGLITGTTCP